MGEMPWQRLSGRAGPPAPRCGTVKFKFAIDVSIMGGVGVSMMIGDADGETVGAGGRMAVRKVDIEVADADIERARARRVVSCIVICICDVSSSDFGNDVSGDVR